MPKTSVFCIASCRNQAELIVDQLKFYGISSGDVSVLYPDTAKNGPKSHHFSFDPAGAAVERGRPGTGAPSVIGGNMGWVRGIKSVVLPGLGGYIAAGPVLAALSGATAAGGAGGIGLGLTALGIPEKQAGNYEDRMRLGHILISVHTESPAEVMQTKFIFTRGRGQDICITDKAIPPQAHPPAPRDGDELPRPSPEFWPELSRPGLNHGGA